MPKILIFILAFLSSHACSQTKPKESFEGIITYKVSFITKSKEGKYFSYQKQKYGNEAKMYVSEKGDFKREYKNSGGMGFDFNIYNHSLNKVFAKWRNIDTIFSLDANNNGLEFLKEERVKGESINGIKCEGYLISARDLIGGQIITQTFFYPTNKEYIDPNLYRNFKDSFYNKVMNKIQSPYYKLKMDMGDYIVVFSLTEIKQQTLNKKTFELPIGLPIKRIN